MSTQQESRVKKTLLNARVNLIFYALSLFVSFFTRKIFLDKLGVDFVGLTTTLQNLLGFLNLAELGIGSAIGYVLYKPIFDKDETKLNEIISVFGYIYRWIGFVIIGAGVILSAFLPLIFKDIAIDMSVVYYVYYSFLSSSLLGYFVNYKQTLLGADQKNYVVAGYLQTTVILKTILQATLAYYTQNYYIWATNEIIFGIIFSLILNWKIAKTYPWLKSDIALGKGLLKKYPEIFTYTKQLFVHKIAGFAQIQVAPFLMYSFVSLESVALYGNYTLIVDKLSIAVEQLLGSTSASVGNLIAEGKPELSLRVFEELSAIRFFVAGVIVFGVYNLMEPFISLWLGNQYLLGDIVLAIISFRLLVSLSRGAIDQFLFGYGLFYDTWSPIVSTISTVIISIVGGYFWGMNGVLLGGITSPLFLAWGWKPIFLFMSGFKLPLYRYWIPFFKNLLAFLSSFIAIRYISIHHITFINPDENLIQWLIYAVITMALYTIAYFVLMWFLSQGLRDAVIRFKIKLTNK